MVSPLIAWAFQIASKKIFFLKAKLLLLQETTWLYHISSLKIFLTPNETELFKFHGFSWNFMVLWYFRKCSSHRWPNDNDQSVKRQLPHLSEVQRRQRRSPNWNWILSTSSQPTAEWSWARLIVTESGEGILKDWKMLQFARDEFSFQNEILGTKNVPLSSSSIISRVTFLDTAETVLVIFDSFPRTAFVWPCGVLMETVSFWLAVAPMFSSSIFNSNR